MSDTQLLGHNITDVVLVTKGKVESDTPNFSKILLSSFSKFTHVQFPKCNSSWERLEVDFIKIDILSENRRFEVARNDVWVKFQATFRYHNYNR